MPAIHNNRKAHRKRQKGQGPITSLPYELLAQIFASANAIDSLSSVAITSVCHYWREVIVNTPQAWLNVVLKIKNENNGRYFDMYLKRGSGRPITLSIASFYNNVEAVAATNEALKDSLDRVSTLTLIKDDLSDRFVDPLEGVFLNLTRLTISNYDWFGIEYISKSTMPRLKFLEITNCVLGNDLSPDLPPIEELRISSEATVLWKRFIASIAKTLTSLTIEARNSHLIDGRENFITLPALQYLEIKDERSALNLLDTKRESVLVDLELKTPKLTRYVEHWPTGNPHKDTAHVTELETHSIPNLINYPAVTSLKLVQVSLEDAIALLGDLTKDAGVVPRLGVVELECHESEWKLSRGDVRYYDKLLQATSFEGSVIRGKGWVFQRHSFETPKVGPAALCDKGG